MISRRQAWRRVDTVPTLKHITYQAYLERAMLASAEMFPSNNFMDEETIMLNDSSTILMKKSPQTLDRSVKPKLKSILSSRDFSIEFKKRDDRKFRFSNKVQVCLIPTRNELSFDGYWTSEDYARFKHEAVSELKQFIKQFKGTLTAKQAVAVLYQPGPEDQCSFVVSIDEENGKSEEKCLLSTSDSMPVSTSCLEDEVHLDDAAHSDSVHSVNIQIKNMTFAKLKTDLELNQLEVKFSLSEFDATESKSANSRVHMPVRTPAAGKERTNVWAVQWQKPSDEKK